MGARSHVGPSLATSAVCFVCMKHFQMTGLFVLTLFSACEVDSPAKDEAQRYADAIAPLTLDNGLLAWRVLHLAADVHDGRADGSKADAAWRDDVVPLAWHLRDQAALISPPANWGDHHEALVKVWTDRAVAYEDLADAVEDGDLSGFEDAKKRANQALMSEEELFKRLDGQLLPHGITVDQFP